MINNVNICSPASLQKKDLNQFNKKCKTLRKKDITSHNINEKLDILYSLNLPDGGVELGTYFKEIYKNSSKLEQINHYLIELLIRGIIPMNKMNIYHADIKESNILVDKKKSYPKLIDWGLAFYNTGNDIPSILWNKPLQYNLPFSVILFNDTFENMYLDFLSEYDIRNHNVERNLIDFVRSYVNVWNKERGEGHLKTIQIIWEGVTGTKNVTNDVIVPYLTKILMTFTNNQKFNLKSYFKNVFLKNIDIWGFLMAYSPLLELNVTLDIDEIISYIYITKLYEHATQPININQLVQQLEYLVL